MSVRRSFTSLSAEAVTPLATQLSPSISRTFTATLSSASGGYELCPYYAYAYVYAVAFAQSGSLVLLYVTVGGVYCVNTVVALVPCEREVSFAGGRKRLRISSARDPTSLSARPFQETMCRLFYRRNSRRSATSRRTIPRPSCSGRHVLTTTGVPAKRDGIPAERKADTMRMARAVLPPLPSFIVSVGDRFSLEACWCI